MRISMGALMLVALAAGVSIAPACAEDKTTTIGVLAALTGGAAADGEETQRGAQLAIDEI